MPNKEIKALRAQIAASNRQTKTCKMLLTPTMEIERLRVSCTDYKEAHESNSAIIKEQLQWQREYIEKEAEHWRNADQSTATRLDAVERLAKEMEEAGLGTGGPVVLQDRGDDMVKLSAVLARLADSGEIDRVGVSVVKLANAFSSFSTDYVAARAGSVAEAAVAAAANTSIGVGLHPALITCAAVAAIVLPQLVLSYGKKAARLAKKVRRSETGKEAEGGRKGLLGSVILYETVVCGFDHALVRNLNDEELHTSARLKSNHLCD
ncbi:hypothetical protein K440DRAFT_688554 [Wilcoxina mikolae CBS 423.85]|nr:hypothetical protein K440DRAFT_688554 [Wilcoxina mikolae CBS 423.85]